MSGEAGMRPGLSSGVDIMLSNALRGRSILVVEEEPHIACGLAAGLRCAGAKVFAADKLPDALYLAEHPALSAAVLNLRLGDDTTARVCRRLAHLGVPFMLLTRYDASEASKRWPEAPVVNKPAEAAVVVDTVVRLVH
jgi:DNA-binding response OmpR family regulator